MFDHGRTQTASSRPCSSPTSSNPRAMLPSSATSVGGRSLRRMTTPRARAGSVPRPRDHYDRRRLPGRLRRTGPSPVIVVPGTVGVLLVELRLLDELGPQFHVVVGVEVRRAADHRLDIVVVVENARAPATRSGEELTHPRAPSRSAAPSQRGRCQLLAASRRGGGLRRLRRRPRECAQLQRRHGTAGRAHREKLNDPPPPPPPPAGRPLRARLHVGLYRGAGPALFKKHVLIVVFSTIGTVLSSIMCSLCLWPAAL